MNRAVLSLISLSLMLLLPVGPAGAAETSPVTAATPKAIPIEGKVLETFDGGGYTYLRLKNGSDAVWVAVPSMKVAVGQEIALIPGFEMKNFTSKALNRKFDRVIFSAGVAKERIPLSPSAIKMLHQGVTPPAKEKEKVVPLPPPTAPPVQRVDIDLRRPPAQIKVSKAKGPNAHTVVELYAKRAQLEKKAVVLRGKVVKVSSHIMKKNWYHIQDGTGSSKKKNDDIVVVSTSALAREGDLVTIKGILFNNIDYGSGYKYQVIVLDASLIR